MMPDRKWRRLPVQSPKQFQYPQRRHDQTRTTASALRQMVQIL
jgi:hypothetical protein